MLPGGVLRTILTDHNRILIMIQLKKWTLGLILLVLFAGCEKDQNDHFHTDTEFVRYGTSFGECFGYCKNEIYMNGREIDFQKNGWGQNGALPEVSMTQEIDAKYWQAVMRKLDFDSFAKLDSVIGCPDCADGGAEWVEIKSGGKSHKVVFEYGRAPEEIAEYIGYLRTYQNAFRIDGGETVDFNAQTLIDQSGFIKNFVATRGSYQWLIGIEDRGGTTYYYDEHLSDRYHTDGLKIEFNGILEHDSTMIHKPAPDDVPVPDFKARNICAVDVRIVNE